MSKIFLTAFYFLLANATVFAQQFNPDWEFSLSGSEVWNEAKIPGCNFTDLMAIKAIPNPFYGANEDSVQWVSKCNWSYKTKAFDIAEDWLSAQQLLVRFPVLDGTCTVYFNDKKIIEANNSFRIWEADVIKYAKPNGNIIKIDFISPVNEALILAKKFGFSPTGDARVFLRKAPFQSGWDWGPNLPSVGIGQSPELIPIRSIELFGYRVLTKKIHENEAELELRIEINSTKKSNINLDFSVDEGLILQENLQVFKGKREYVIPFKILNPHLWWPHDMKAPYLYDSQLKINQNDNVISKSKKFGIREIELVQEPGPDEGSRGFAIEINQQQIFVKGANYIPQDIFLNRVENDDYRMLLKDVVESNMNMVRVWGGGVYERELFYDLCDSLGILVWQDFMFACAMYPGNPDFLNNVEQEAMEQTRRLSSHPCIALFCGNNEISEGWARWGWKDNLSKFNVRKLQRAYDNIFLKILPNAVSKNSYVPYWESSPELGRGDPEHVNKGDAHYWGVWHDAEPFDNFKMKVPRFMSEFGFQSYPSIFNLSNYIPEEERYIGSPSMKIHQKHGRGDQLIKDYMSRWFDVPDDFERFVYLSQVLQAEGMRIGIDAHIAARPHCMGTLYWQLNDCWPAVSWSSREYGGRWKMMQYMVQDAYKPVRLLSDTIEGNLVVQLVNATSFDLDARVDWQLMDIYGNVLQMGDVEQKALQQKNTRIENLSIAMKSSPVAPLLIVFKMTAGSHRDLHIHYLSEIGDYRSTERKMIFSLQRSGNDRIIELSSAQLERGVWIEADAEGSFSQNYFDLLPGEKRRITFNAQSEGIHFKIYSFNGNVIEFNENDFAPFIQEPIQLIAPGPAIEYKWFVPEE